MNNLAIIGLATFSLLALTAISVIFLKSHETTRVTRTVVLALYLVLAVTDLYVLTLSVGRYYGFATSASASVEKANSYGVIVLAEHEISSRQSLMVLKEKNGGACTLQGAQKSLTWITSPTKATRLVFWGNDGTSDLEIMGEMLTYGGSTFLLLEHDLPSSFLVGSTSAEAVESGAGWALYVISRGIPTQVTIDGVALSAARATRD